MHRAGIRPLIVLHAGKVVQDGAPGWLMRRDGLYRDLLRRQMMPEREAA